MTGDNTRRKGEAAGLREKQLERGVSLLPSGVIAVLSCMVAGCPGFFLKQDKAEEATSHQRMGGDWTKRWVTGRGHNSFTTMLSGV